MATLKLFSQFLRMRCETFCCNEASAEAVTDILFKTDDPCYPS